MWKSLTGQSSSVGAAPSSSSKRNSSSTSHNRSKSTTSSRGDDRDRRERKEDRERERERERERDRDRDRDDRSAYYSTAGSTRAPPSVSVVSSYATALPGTTRDEDDAYESLRGDQERDRDEREREREKESKEKRARSASSGGWVRKKGSGSSEKGKKSDKGKDRSRSRSRSRERTKTGRLRSRSHSRERSAHDGSRSRRSESRDLERRRTWSDRDEPYSSSRGQHSSRRSDPEYDSRDEYDNQRALVRTSSSTRAPSYDVHANAQFPGQMSTDAAEPYRPPPSPGHAADYYGDQGQSVFTQPGIRTTPDIIQGYDSHLMTPHSESKPPVEPSQIGQMGAAAEFYGIGPDEPTLVGSSSSKPSKPGKPGKPGKQNLPPKPTHSNSAPLMSGAIGAATGAAAAYAYNSHHNSQEFSSSQTQQTHTYGIEDGPTNGNGPAYAQSSGSNVYLHPSEIGDAAGPRPSKPSKHHSYDSNLPAYAAGGLAAGAAYAALHNNHNHHQHHHTQYESYNNGNGYNNGYAAGPGFNGMPMQHRPSRRGPLNKFVNFFRDPDAVAQYEEYTEFIGVCRYCFEPGSSPRDAPRKHYYDPRRKRSSHSLRGRVEKGHRYYSSGSSSASFSDEEGRRVKKRSSKKAGWLGAGLAAYGIGKISKSLFQNDGFEDGMSMKSGRRERSGGRSYHANESTVSLGKRSVTSRGVTKRYRSTSRERHDRLHGHGHVEGMTSDGRIVRRDSRGHLHASNAGSGILRRSSHSRTRTGISSSRSRSRSNHRSSSGLVGAAVGAGVASAMAGKVVRRFSRSRSRSPIKKGKKGVLVKRSSRGSLRERRQSQSTSGGGFAGFFSAPSENVRRGKKKRGFFGLSGSSASSSDEDADLAFGEEDEDRRRVSGGSGKYGKRRSSGAVVKRRGSREGLDATLIGLGAASAALMAANAGRHSHSHSPRYGKQLAITDSRHRRSMERGRGVSLSSLGSRTSHDDEFVDDEWEDASDDRSEVSVDSGLAYGGGVSARQSKESLASEQGLAKWGWRWGSKKPKKQHQQSDHRRHEENDYGRYVGPAVAGAAAAGAVYGASKYDDRHDAMTTSQSSLPPMQYVDPAPLSEHNSASSLPRPPLPLMTSSRDSIPLQQPQPKSQVSQAVYSAHPHSGPHSPAYVEPSGPPVFANVPTSTALERYSGLDAHDNHDGGRRIELRDDVDDDRHSHGRIRPRRSQSSPEAFFKPDATTSFVQFDLDKERADKESLDNFRLDRDRRARSGSASLSKKERERQIEDELERLKQEDRALREKEKERKRDSGSSSTIKSKGKDETSASSSSWVAPVAAGAAAIGAVALAERHREHERSRSRSREREHEREMGKSDSADERQRREERRKERREQRRRERKDSYDEDASRVAESLVSGPSSASTSIPKAPSPPRTEEEERRRQKIEDDLGRRIAKMAAERLQQSVNNPSEGGPVVHEDYATYFSPDLKGAETPRNQENDRDVNIVEIVPPHVRYNSEAFVNDVLRDGKNMPWPIPSLKLIEPTPPASTRDAASPRPWSPSGEVIPEAGEGEEKELEQEREREREWEREREREEEALGKAGSRVSWGKPETREFDVVTPVSDEEGDRGERRRKQYEQQREREEEPKVSYETKPVSPTSSSFARDVDLVRAESPSTIEQKPHPYESDLDFAATLAAGAEAAGFDSNIVLNDPTFHRRDSPPGSEDKGVYVSPEASKIAEGRGSPPQIWDVATPFETPVEIKGDEAGGYVSLPREYGYMPASTAPTAVTATTNKRGKESDSKSDEDVAFEVARDMGFAGVVASLLDKKGPSQPTSASSDVGQKSSAKEYDIPETRSMPGGFDDEASSTRKEKKEKSKRKDRRDFEMYVESPTQETETEVFEDALASKAGDDDDKSRPEEREQVAEAEAFEDAESSPSSSKKKSKRRSKRDSGDYFDDNDDARSVAASAPGDFDREDRSEKKHRRKSKRSSLIDDDNMSVVSSPAKIDESKKKEKKGGLFGLFGGIGSRSEVNLNDEKEREKDRDKDKERHHRRRSSHRDSDRDEYADSPERERRRHHHRHDSGGSVVSSSKRSSRHERDSSERRSVYGSGSASQSMTDLASVVSAATSARSSSKKERKEGRDRDEDADEEKERRRAERREKKERRKSKDKDGVENV